MREARGSSHATGECCRDRGSNRKRGGRAVRQEEGFKRCDWEMSQEKGKGKGRERTVADMAQGSSQMTGGCQGKGSRHATAVAGMRRVQGGCDREM